MNTVSTIIMFLSIFDPCFSPRIAENMKILFRGATLATGARTTTACMMAALPWLTKHWTTYENTVRVGKFCMLHLAKVLVEYIISMLPEKGPIYFLARL
jgi:hypothetical protein